MLSPSDRTRANLAVALALLVVGAVLVKRAPAIGAALVVCGMVTTYLALAARRGR
jgi:hypothetical protein